MCSLVILPGQVRLRLDSIVGRTTNLPCLVGRAEQLPKLASLMARDLNQAELCTKFHDQVKPPAGICRQKEPLAELSVQVPL